MGDYFADIAELLPSISPLRHSIRRHNSKLRDMVTDQSYLDVFDDDEEGLLVSNLSSPAYSTEDLVCSE